MQRKVTFIFRSLFAVSAVLYVIKLYRSGNQQAPAWQFTVDDRATKDYTLIRKKDYDWILTSSMRSGSSITGQLLGHRHDTFYWFEPLEKLDAYFWSRDRVCYDTFVDTNCRVLGKGDHTTEEAVGTIQHMLNCNFSLLHNLPYRTMLPKYSGFGWVRYEECIKGRKDVNVQQRCLRDQEIQCKTARHRGFKIIRLLLHNVDALLEANDNLKVLHLFRDPRATINSRSTTSWYPFPNMTEENQFQAKIENAKHLCNRLLHEAHVAKFLRQKYPTRFSIIFYEDLFKDIRTNIKQVFNFLNIHSTEESWQNVKIGVIDKHDHSLTYPKKQKDFHTWWRKQMNYTLVREIDYVCRHVYDALGYAPVKSETMMKDLSIDLYNFNSQFLVESIHSGKPYDSIR